MMVPTLTMMIATTTRTPMTPLATTRTTITPPVTKFVIAMMTTTIIHTTTTTIHTMIIIVIPMRIPLIIAIMDSHRRLTAASMDSILMNQP